MQKNMVQFQKGLSLHDFLDEFGPAEQCEQALFRMRRPDGLGCDACGSHSFCRLRRRRVFQCNRCKRQVSLLAGTILQSTKLPLNAWFLAIDLLTPAKNGISALEAGRHLGVNDSTAWKLKHKLLQVMQERDAGRKLSGTVQMDDACPGGERHGGKRGRGAAGKTPPVIAVQVTGATGEQQPVVRKPSLVAGFRKAELGCRARENLKPGTTVQSDGLGCFRGVEAAGCRHGVTVRGGGAGSCDLPQLARANTMLGNVKRSLDGTYHAVKAKHAGRYLAEFQYRCNCRYDLAARPQRLLRAAAATLPLPYPILTAEPFCGARPPAGACRAAGPEDRPA